MLDVYGFKHGTVLVTAGETPVCGSINASTLQRHETSCSLASFGKIFNDSLQIDPVNALRFPIR